MANMRRPDRLARLFLGLLLAEAGFFWLGGGLLVAAYLVALVLLATAVLGSCPLYRLAGIGRTLAAPAAAGWLTRIAVPVLAVLLLVAFAIASNFASRKFFLEEFNAMNNEYKQALFHSGKGDRAQAMRHYELLATRFMEFGTKYEDYRPWALRGDASFGTDLKRVSGFFSAARPDVAAGDLQKAHLTLEEARPLLQGILRRNNFSLLAVALVDFHDPMELIVEAAQRREVVKVGALYAEVSESLKAVEAQANDPDIQAIRRNLDDLRVSAQAGKLEELSARAEQLKRSFAKVYLARG